MTNFSISFSSRLALSRERLCLSSRRRLDWFCCLCWSLRLVRCCLVDRFCFVSRFFESNFALDRRRSCSFCFVCCFCRFCDYFCARFCDVCWWWCDWQHRYVIMKYFQSKVNKRSTIWSTSLMRSLCALSRSSFAHSRYFETSLHVAQRSTNKVRSLFARRTSLQLRSRVVAISIFDSSRDISFAARDAQCDENDVDDDTCCLKRFAFRHSNLIIVAC